MAIHSSVLAWRILWTEEPSGLYSPWGRKELDMTEQLTHTMTCYNITCPTASGKLNYILVRE